MGNACENTHGLTRRQGGADLEHGLSADADRARFCPFGFGDEAGPGTGDRGNTAAPGLAVVGGDGCRLFSCFPVGRFAGFRL